MVAGLVATSGMAFAAPVLSVLKPGTSALVDVAVVALIAISRKGKKYLAEGFPDDGSPFSGCHVRVGQLSQPDHRHQFVAKCRPGGKLALERVVVFCADRIWFADPDAGQSDRLAT